MRAPFQILAIPYRRSPDLQFCVFHRADFDQYQFISGGGEDAEIPFEAALREIWEETGIKTESIMPLTSLAYIPASIFSEAIRSHWSRNTWVVPEYTFTFECRSEIILSSEHTGYEWLNYDAARSKLTWDSNKTALYEAYCRLMNVENSPSRRSGIRIATIDDAAQLRELNEMFNGAGESTIDHVRRSLLHNKQEIVFVAEEDDILVGFVCVQLKRSFCYANPSVEITEVFVKPEFRRRGIASRLISFAESECAKHLQIHNFELLTGANNHPARRLYQLLGYSEDQEIHLSKSQ
ncbi:MAG: GNAT family N-acetyltransferase [Clostridia bacterium]|nr:GNAT family N-acetyltransferase [Clostridia bacterium]